MVKRRGERFAVPLVAACAAATAAAPLAGADAVPALTANIVFTSNAPATGGHFRITVMNTDGAGTALNPNPSGAYDDIDPSWSPDGTRIAFASDRDGDFDVYVMKADGSGVTQVTREPRSDRCPAWSPDGTRITYRGYAGPTGGSQIFVMASDGSRATPLPHTYGGDQPTWSPDGARIAYSGRVASGSSQDGDAAEIDDELYVIAADGSGAPANITNSPSNSDRYPAWSPGGGTIAFRRLESAGRELRAVAPEGGPVRDLTAVFGPGRAPSWSPDGKSLVFVSYRDGDRNQEIWLGSLDGVANPPRQLTFNTWTNDQPRWANVPVTESPVAPSSGGTTGAGGGGSNTTVGGGTIPATGRPALALTIAARHAQRLGRRRSVVVKARCNQLCSIVARGEVRIRRAGRTRILRLASVARTLNPSVWARLRVPIPHGTLHRIRRSLRHRRAVPISLSAIARTSFGAFTPRTKRTLRLTR